MKNVKKYLPYIALAIAIVLQYYVAYNNKIPKHQNEVVYQGVETTKDS